MFGLSQSELSTFKKLTTPIKIQNFLDQFPINWEKNGETYLSPRRVLREKKMHCLEGALLAAVALWIHGEKPLLLDLKTKGDDDHVVTLYKKGGRWGAISKTNHATLRWRDPIYKTIRELAVSYFHEYFINKTGQKTLRSFSKPFNLANLGTKWITSEENLFSIADAIDKSPHLKIFPNKNIRFLRPADKMEKRAGQLIEWKKNPPAHLMLNDMNKKPFTSKQFKNIYSKVPRVTVNLVVATQGGVVLTLRRLPSWNNMWHLPGGTILYQETIKEAAARVAWEELGISIKIKKLLGYIEYPSEKRERGFGCTIGLAALCQTKAKNFQINNEASKVGIFKKLPANTIAEEKKFLNKHKKFLV